MNGTYEEIEGRPALRFERSFKHPVERVWSAVSDPEEMRRWFPATVTVDLRPGGAMSFEFDDPDAPATTGEITELDPPRLLAFSWGGDLLRFELEPEGKGSRLVFIHFLSQRNEAARNAAGWDVCLRELDRHVAGEPASAPGIGVTPEWRDLYDGYVSSGMPSGAPIPEAS
jgi:uncharacterized protein YndB with AHSA1/START domain